MKRSLLIFSVFILVLVFGAVSAFAAGDDFTPYKVVCSGVSLDKGYEYHDNIYISLDDFMAYGDTHALTVDMSKYQIFFDPADLDIYIGNTETSRFIQENAGLVHVSMRAIGSKAYVPLKLLSQIAKLNYDISGERITLYPQSSSAELMRINQKCNAAASLFEASGQNYVLAEGQLCSIVKEFTAFTLVDIVGGEQVYVMKDCISPIEEDDNIPDFTFTAKTKQDFGRQFNIAWDSSPTVPAVIDRGLDVICPFEWFYQMVEKDGTLGNNANIGYTDTAHDLGYQVWATVTNAFTTSGSTKYTTKVLADSSLRNKTIAQYLLYAALYNVDGINVDYEDLTSSDKSGFTAFISTLSDHAENMGLSFSVATLVPESWNFAIYDYARLGEKADYITVMTYDEHFNNSDVSGPGSCSSKGWYTRNIDTLMEYVPAEKILMGVPLYSFINRYDADGVFAAYGKWSAKSVQTCITKAKQDGRMITGPTWIEEDGQYYMEYKDSEGVYVNKLWVEDQRSVLVRMQTAVEKGLAGTACWQISYVDSSFYALFDRVYSDGEVPSDIISTLQEY